MLRLATQEDFGDVLDLAKRFHEASPYKGLEFSIEECDHLFSTYLKGDKRSLIIILACDPSPYGMIIGFANALPFSKDRIATELAWWVNEDKRGSKESIMLLKAYEDWAVRIGAKMTQVAMLDEVTDLKKFYQRQGYRPAEQSYVR